MLPPYIMFEYVILYMYYSRSVHMLCLCECVESVYLVSFLCCIHVVTTDSNSIIPSKLILNGAFLPCMLQCLSISSVSQLCPKSYLTEMSRPQTAPTMGLVCAVVDLPSPSLSDARVDGSSGLEVAAAFVWCGRTDCSLQDK